MSDLNINTRSMTAFYVIALGIIACLSISSHILLDYMLYSNEGYSSLINISGRQRMLSQRIALYSEHLADHPTNLHSKRRYIEAINLFEKSHKRLSVSAPVLSGEKGNISELHSLFFQGSDSLDFEVKNYILLARKVLNSKVTPYQIRDYSNELQKLADDKILSKLDKAVTLFQKESEERLSLLGMVQWGMLGVILVTLALEAFFLFRPMIKKIVQLTNYLSRLANIDYLTRLDNRRHFFNRAEKEFQRAVRAEKNIVFLMIDIDNFKTINDINGHGAGDQVLFDVARSLESAVRAEDLIGRIGGEEFAILLVETDISKCLPQVERIRRIVENTKSHFDNKEIAVTISIGVAEAVPCSISDAALKADKALYAAKSAGRNCSMVNIRGNVMPVSEYTSE